MASVAHLWPSEAFLAHFGDARRLGCERAVQSACRDPVRRVAPRARPVECAPCGGTGLEQEGLWADLSGELRSLGPRPRGGKGSRRGNCSPGWSGGMKTGPSREGPFLKGPYQVDTGGGRGGSEDRGRRWSTPVAWEAGDQALFPMTSRWR